MRSQDLALIVQQQAAIQLLLHLNTGSGIACSVCSWEDLQGMAVVLHGVILRYSPPLLDAEHAIYVQSRIYRAVGWFRVGGRDSKASVEAGKEVREDLLRVDERACPGQA